MQKQEYRRQMNKIAPDELLIRRTESLMSGRRARAGRRRAPVRVALTAAVALVLLAGIALASGFLESVFLQMKGRYVQQDVDYEAVHQAAATDVFSQKVELPGTDAPMLVSVRESYYDGESLMLGFEYTVPHRPASFNFGPGDAHFSQLEPLGSVMLELENDLTQAEYQRYRDELKKNGKVGSLYYSTYLSDGVYGGGGEELTPGTDAHDQLPDGTQWRMLEIEPPLPESLRNRDEIGIRFRVVQRPTYYYEDETGKYWSMPLEEQVAVPLTASIPKSEANAVRHQADAKRTDYAVHVEAVAAPAYVKATFTLDVPEEWAKAADNEAFFTTGKSPVDFVCDFILVGHGTKIEGKIIEAGTNTASNDLSEMSGTYPPLFDGEDKMIFRPVYVNSGPRPEEDIVIDIKP
jgi:hypothetical protein